MHVFEVCLFFYTEAYDTTNHARAQLNSIGLCIKRGFLDGCVMLMQYWIYFSVMFITRRQKFPTKIK